MLDERNHWIKLKNKTIDLTPTEVKIFKRLYKDKNNYVSFKNIIKVLYGNVEIDSNTKRDISVYITRLKRKIKPDIQIITKKTVGYMLIPPKKERKQIKNVTANDRIKQIIDSIR